MNDTTQQLSVVIPCLNEAARLPLLLADLQRITPNAEILLADGGSSDATQRIATLAGASLIKVHPAGRGRQLRAAAAEARGEWLLFLHAEVFNYCYLLPRLHPYHSAQIKKRAQTGYLQPSGSSVHFIQSP